MSEWKPIDTAPRDGTEFQGWVRNPEPEIEGHIGFWVPRCRINPESDAFEMFGRIDYDCEDWATIASWLVIDAWMPLPSPPQEAGE